MFLVLLSDFVLYARIVIGDWPAPYSPDPKEIGLDLGYLVIGWCVLILLSVLVSMYLLVKHDRPARPSETRLALAVVIISWTVFLWVIKNDPGSYLLWLAD